MFTFTVLLSIMFAILYISQSTRSIRRIIIRGRIINGRLSYNDIVNLSAQMFTGRHYIYSYFMPNLSGRVYMSTNNCLYHRQLTDGHVSIKFISYQDGLDYLKFHTINSAIVFSQHHRERLMRRNPVMVSI